MTKRTAAPGTPLRIEPAQVVAVTQHQSSEIPPTPPAATKRDHLDSWKEIAAYLHRGVRTVKRWEKEEGLPVHRHLHRRLGSVYAYKAEVDEWLTTRGTQLAAEEADANVPSQAPTVRRTLPLAAGVAGLLLVLLLVALQLGSDGLRAPARGRLLLAVLPFENLSGDADQDFFSDGLTEELIIELGQIQPDRLGLIARTSSMVYKGAKKNVTQIAAELKIDYLLAGSVRRDGARVRISAQLIRASDQTQLWAQSYERDLSGIFEVQSEVVRAIASQIQLTLNPNRRASLRGSQTTSVAAYEAALRGRYFLDRRTADDLRKAMSYFEHAIDLDSGYALAHVGLADAYILSTTYLDQPTKEAMTRARHALQTALDLDDQLPEAHAWLGIVLSEYDWDWQGADQQFRRAIDLNPNYAYAHKLYAEYLSYMGRFSSAIAEARLARELDPLSMVTNTTLGLALYRARRYDEALVELRQTVEMDRNHPMPYLPLGLVYVMKNMDADAIAALNQALALAPQSSEMIAQLALAHGRFGRPEHARSALTTLTARAREQHVSPFSFALVHLALGDIQTAITWLERAYEERDWYLSVIKTEPILDPLRGEPRFHQLLRRMQFPE